MLKEQIDIIYILKDPLLIKEVFLNITVMDNDLLISLIFLLGAFIFSFLLKDDNRFKKFCKCEINAFKKLFGIK